MLAMSVLLLFFFLCCGATGFNLTEQGWISVGRSTAPGAKYVFQDEHGREVMWRGININLQGYRPINSTDSKPFKSELYRDTCPEFDTRWKNPPLCGVDAGKGKYQPTGPGSHNDLAQIREAGLDLVRIGVTWDLLEPLPGRISLEYLDRIAQVVAWSKEQDCRCIIDMHQDWWGYGIEGGSRIGGNLRRVIAKTQ